MSLRIRVRTSLKKFSQQHPLAYKYLTLLVKVSLTVIALIIVFRQTDWRSTKQLAEQIPVHFLVVGCVLYTLSKLLSALRLKTILRVQDIKLSNGFNIRLYFQGMFYNLFLPGGIGGDAYKALAIQQKTQQPLKKVIVGLLLDRISGVVALLLLVFVFLFMIDIQVPKGYKIIFGAALLLAIPTWLGFLYLFFRSSLPIFIPSLTISLLVQLVQVLQAWILLAGLQVSNGWLAYALVFLLSSLATLIPVTIGGLGARELVFVFAASYLGISQEIAVTFSLLFFLTNVICSLPGIFVRNSKPK